MHFGGFERFVVKCMNKNLFFTLHYILFYAAFVLIFNIRFMIQSNNYNYNF